MGTAADPMLPAAYCPPGQGAEARAVLDALGETYGPVIETPAVDRGILLAGATIRVIDAPGDPAGP